MGHSCFVACEWLVVSLFMRLFLSVSYMSFEEHAQEKISKDSKKEGLDFFFFLGCFINVVTSSSSNISSHELSPFVLLPPSSLLSCST